MGLTVVSMMLVVVAVDGGGMVMKWHRLRFIIIITVVSFSFIRAIQSEQRIINNTRVVVYALIAATAAAATPSVPVPITNIIVI